MGVEWFCFPTKGIKAKMNYKSNVLKQIILQFLKLPNDEINKLILIIKHYVSLYFKYFLQVSKAMCNKF